MRNEKIKKFFITLFFGGFGVHKFYEGKIGIGILYLLTCGFWCIGWGIDTIKAFIELFKKENSNNIVNNNIKNEKEIHVTSQNINEDINMEKPKGNVEYEKVYLTSEIVEDLKNKYIAFDIETTGLSPIDDRIIELGAVLFENGIPTKRFSSLVNPNKLISIEASKVNNISYEMIENAPKENDVYPKLMYFLGDALSGETIICAHNAQFDISFLSNTLERLGYNGKIRYADTLSISKDILYGLKNYKQNTIAEYFGIINEDQHRAITDAETCGKILDKLLKFEVKEVVREDKNNNEINVIPFVPLNDCEKIILAYIVKLLYDNNLDLKYVGARKISSGYVSVCYLYDFLKYRIIKNGMYIIVSNEFSKKTNLQIEDCSQNEGKETNVRVYVNSLDEMKQLDQYVIETYNKANKDFWFYLGNDKSEQQYIAEVVDRFYKIKIEEANNIIEDEKSNNVLYKSLIEPKIEKQHKLEEKQKEKEARKLIAEQKKIEKAKKEEERKNKIKEPVVGRSIIQMNDDGTIIKKYISIAEAVRQTGINSKSIRDAAKGVQKHAGGYCWKYDDEIID